MVDCLQAQSQTINNSYVNIGTNQYLLVILDNNFILFQKDPSDNEGDSNSSKEYKPTTKTKVKRLKSKSKFKCRSCEKVCSSFNRLQRHMNTHGINKVKCNLCNKFISGKDHLEVHLIRKHPDVYERINKLYSKVNEYSNVIINNATVYLFLWCLYSIHIFFNLKKQQEFQAGLKNFKIKLNFNQNLFFINLFINHFCRNKLVFHVRAVTKFSLLKLNWKVTLKPIVNRIRQVPKFYYFCNFSE